MKYLVHFQRKQDQIFSPEMEEQEQSRMADLIHEKILNQVFMNTSKNNIWLEMNISNLDELERIVKTLPICSELTAEIHELI